MLRITFARHGEYSGYGAAAELSDKGRSQAQVLANAIVGNGIHDEGTKVLTSTYMRALSTASIIGKTIKQAGLHGVTLDEHPFLNLNSRGSIVGEIEKSGEAVANSAKFLARLTAPSIIAVSHAENILLLTAVFAKQGGCAFALNTGECVTYEIDAESWDVAADKGLDNCSQQIWTHGKPLEMCVV